MIQEPQQLLPSPVRVDLLSSVSPSFKTTMSSTDNLWATTLQGGGIFLYDKETKTPKHSLAVGADVQFACPPAIGLLNTEEQHDDQMETPSINQMLYAAVNKGTNEMELCAWALDEDLLSLKNPTATIKMDQRVSCILALGNDCILVGLVSGSLSLLSPNLCQTLSVHPKEPVGNNEPVWSAVSSADNKKEWIWWSVSQVSGETHKWTVDAIVLVGDDTVPGKVRYESATTFTFTSHATTIASISCFARQISVAFSNGLSQTWQVKGSNKVSDPAALDLAFLGLEPKSLSTQILKNNYLAVVGKEVASAAGGLKLFVLDNRFGTLQHEQDLATNGLSESRLRTSMSVSSSGEDLHLCVRSDSKASFTANFFTSATDCPPMSLKMALGKSAKKGHFSSSAPGELIGPFGMSFIPSEMPGSSSKTEWKKSLDTANKSESAFMARLLAAKTEKDFEAALKAWVMAKTGVSDKNSKLSSLPPMTLSQPLLAQLNDKCFGTPATFWPREAIQYLLRSGLCNIFSCSSDIIKAILHRKDVDSLLLAMDVLKDIAEADWVAVLTFALTYAETPALDVSVKASGKWISHTAMDVDSEDQCVLTVGQEYLVYRSLTCPRNDPRLIQAFRKLPIEQVEILLKWLESVLIPEASKKRMWWFWSQEESGVQPEDYEKELSRFTASVEALSLITDAQKINIIMASDLADIIERIHMHLQKENEFFQVFQDKVFGLLRPFAESKMQRAARQTQDNKNRRWKRMVKDIQDDCGSYSIEVLKV